MAFRVTPLSLISQTVDNVRMRNANLAKLQQQASTGLRIQKPSDQPASFHALAILKGDDKRFDVDLRNLQSAQGRLNAGVAQLREANNVLIQARQLAAEARQSGEKAELAAEIDGLLDRLRVVVNSRYEGGFLFGGAAGDGEPFRFQKVDGKTEVVYTGSNRRAETVVGYQYAVDSFFTGSELFQSRSRGETAILGNTGAKAGTGTNSELAVASLTVRHTSTSYQAGSGVAAGTSSAAGDSIIGPAGAHVLTIVDTSGTGTAGTVSLNNGPPVPFSSLDTNLQVVDHSGRRVFIDTTSITPGFNGDVDITAGGTLSMDGGLNEVPIDFSANQVLQNQTTGRVTNIDSTGIRRTGVDTVEYSGTADIFQTLTQLRNDLLNADSMTETEFQDAISRRISDLDRHGNSVISSIGEMSVVLENVDSLIVRAQDLQLSTRVAISELESADLTEIVLKLTNEQNLLQYTFASTVGLLDASLLSFLR